MKWITPFAFIDDAGDLHLCCDKLLEGVGLPLTEENMRIAERTIIEQMRRAQPATTIISFVEGDLAAHPDRIEKE